MASDRTSILMMKRKRQTSRKLKKKTMNPMARSVMRSGLTMKLVIISLRAFKIFSFEMFVFFSIERLNNSFCPVWDLCFGIFLVGLC